jgi:anti-anti-sigma factor
VTQDFSVASEPACWVKVIGEVDVSNAQDLAASIDQPGPLVLDCSDLTFMDSAGFAVLVAAFKRARKNGSHFLVTGMSGTPLRSLQILKLDYLITGTATDDESRSR